MQDRVDERQARYTRMDEGTVEDYALLEELRKPFEEAAVDRVLAHLELLRDSYPGNRNRSLPTLATDRDPRRERWRMR